MKAAFKYFVTDLSSYFCWTNHGLELSWFDGTTVAFREEILAVLTHLKESNRFADFTSIALALAATRKSWPDVVSRLILALGIIHESKYPAISQHVRTKSDVFTNWRNDTVRKLNLLSKAANDGRLEFAQLVALLSMVLGERETGYSWDDQATFVAVLKAEFPDDWVDKSLADESVRRDLLPKSERDLIQSRYSGEASDAESRNSNNTRISQEIFRILRIIRVANSLAAAIPCDTVEELIALVRTGISTPGDVKAAEVDIVEDVDQKTKVRNLLTDLLQDQELSGLARLTKRLIAAITLPRQLSEPDELQMGGVSDIANRGQLDKLLLSELAHDDLTLSVRLALNEALYLRRESPPSTQISTRCVLIDISLPMWGIPRIYSLAAALALQATTDKQTRIRYYRGEDRNLIPVTFNGADSVAGHLAALSTTATPALVLPAFFEAVEELDAAAEPVIILTSDTLELDDFRMQLDSVWPRNVWLVVVERDGRLDILQKTRQGTSLHRRIQLPLKDIMNERDADTLRRSDVPGDLPAILRLKQLPLLLSHPVRAGRLWAWNKLVLGLTDDGRLMLWESENKGARELTTCLPVASKHHCRIADRWTGEIAIYCSVNGQDTGTLIHVNRSNMQVNLVPVEHKLDEVTDVHRTDSALLIFGTMKNGCTACCAIAYPTPGVPAVLELPRYTDWRCGRVVRMHDTGFHVLDVVTTDGLQTMWSLQRLPEALQLFPQVIESDHGGFVAIDNEGQFADPTGQHAILRLIEQYCRTNRIKVDRVTAVSHGLIEAYQSDSSQPLVVDVVGGNVLSGPATNCSNGDLATVEFQIAAKKIDHRTSHYRFRSIGSDGQVLFLKNAGGAWFQIDWQTSNHGIHLHACGKVPEGIRMSEFNDCPKQPNVGFTLQQAIWHNGKAWLDSRALLHLKSYDDALPEISLVLRDGILAGWASDATVFGDQYYIPGNSEASGMTVISGRDAWRKYLLPMLRSFA